MISKVVVQDEVSPTNCDDYEVVVTIKVIVGNVEEGSYIVELNERWQAMLNKVINGYNHMIEQGEYVSEAMEMAWMDHGRSQDGTTCG
jgi:hypothetical protein